MKRAEHIKQTERQFRARKRKEFNDLQKAAEKFLNGAAYLPETPHIYFGIICSNIRSMAKMLRPWWRKA